jgi:small-conductance mechanosensitive channel
MLIHLLKKTRNIWLTPLLIMTLLSVSHLLFAYYADYLTQINFLSLNQYFIEYNIYKITMTFCAYWIFARLINRSSQFLKRNLYKKSFQNLSIVVPFIVAILKVLVFLIFLNILFQQLKLPKELSYILSKISSILIICAISWILFKIVDVSQELLMKHYALQNDLAERKIYTQTLILRRVAYSIISILTVGAILTLFETVRALGASVLTTAGILGLVLTFTAQRSLSSIFSGLELAFTQPVKIGDSVVIEGEFGTIEEINFRNVIVKLWDWRRLIVPTNFFLEKSFQNWSREQKTNLIGSVILYTDFTLPVAEVRIKLNSLLKNSPYWDQNVGSLEVSDLQSQVMQLKILASAKHSGDLSKLKASIREELIGFIVKTYPYALPQSRSYTMKKVQTPVSFQ